MEGRRQTVFKCVIGAWGRTSRRAPRFGNRGQSQISNSRGIKAGLINALREAREFTLSIGTVVQLHIGKLEMVI